MRTIDYTVEVDLNAYLFQAKNLYDDSLRFSFVLLGERLKIIFCLLCDFELLDDMS